MWYLKEIFRLRKLHFLTVLTSFLAFSLVLGVDVLGRYVILLNEKTLKQMALDTLCLQINTATDLASLPELEKCALLQEEILFEDHVVYGIRGPLKSHLALEIQQGRFLYEGNQNEVVAGSKTSYKCGECVNINGCVFTVTGILKPVNNPLVDLDDSLLISAYLGFGSGSNRNRMLFWKQDGRPWEKLLKKNLGKDNYLFIDQKIIADNMIELIKGVYKGLLALAYGAEIIAIITMTGNSLSSLKRRTYEIGIKKASGASDKDIRRQFMLETLFLQGLAAILAVSLIALLTMILNIRVTIKIGILVPGVFAGSICGLFPALKASHITIVESLQKC